MDTTILRGAYGSLLAEVRQGGFGSPPDGEWTAEQIIAHVAANDELLAAATELVLSGNSDAYYNHDAIDTPRLNELIAQMPDLVGWLEQTSTRLCELAERLDPDDMTAVHTQIVDGEVTRVDQPVPWPVVLKTQAEVHVPAHTRQLRALREPPVTG